VTEGRDWEIGITKGGAQLFYETRRTLLLEQAESADKGSACSRVAVIKIVLQKREKRKGTMINRFLKGMPFLTGNEGHKRGIVCIE